MSEREFASVRTTFVDRVSEDMIKQLVDDLFQDRVLNSGEREPVLQVTNTRADKARALFDMVKNKGEVAIGQMIAHLKRRDPVFFSVLAQQAAAASQMEQTCEIAAALYQMKFQKK